MGDIVAFHFSMTKTMLVVTSKPIVHPLDLCAPSWMSKGHTSLVIFGKISSLIMNSFPIDQYMIEGVRKFI